MSLSGQIFSFVLSTLEGFGYFGIFVLMVIESATLPIPSEVVLPLAGYMIFLGQMNFWITVVIASIGSLVGTLIDYWIGRSVGRTAILRYGKYVKLSEDHLATSERWFDKFGEVTVLLARFVPLIRTLVAFPAGIAEMRIWKFVAFSAVGIFMWDGLLVYLGYLAGKNSSAIISILSKDFAIIEVVAIVVAILAVSVVALRRRKRNPVHRAKINSASTDGISSSDSHSDL